MQISFTILHKTLHIDFRNLYENVFLINSPNNSPQNQGFVFLSLSLLLIQAGTRQNDFFFEPDNQN